MDTIDTKISSIAAVTKYGIPRSSAIYAADNIWSIKWDSSIREAFWHYYLLYWDADFFLSKLQEGTIKRLDRTFQVIYYRCSPIDIQRHKGKQVAISFRVLQPEYNYHPVALVARSDRQANRIGV